MEKQEKCLSVFHKQYVQLPPAKLEELMQKKQYNEDRLRRGLESYNTLHNTNFKIADIVLQGSVAMDTAIQTPQDAYDIDFGIVFEEDNIKNIGPQEIKNIIVKALENQCIEFRIPPSAHTNCVRFYYTAGYHVDVAIYKKCNHTYYHAGAQWAERNPHALNEWFNTKQGEYGQQLSQVIRLSKMLCKTHSRNGLPGGLLQTVCLTECFAPSKNLHQSLHETLQRVQQRLQDNCEIFNPTLPQMSLVPRQEDKAKLIKWVKLLSEIVPKLQQVALATCYEQAIPLYQNIFTHEAFQQAIFKNVWNSCPYEEFIEENYYIDLHHTLTIQCKIEKNGFRNTTLKELLRKGFLYPYKQNLYFSCSTDIHQTHAILWKIRNVGEEADRLQNWRGKIVAGDDKDIRHEQSQFPGEHYVECYAILNDVCVARQRLDVPITAHKR